MAAVYILGQLIGAVIGYGLLKVLYGCLLKWNYIIKRKTNEWLNILGR